MSFQIKQYYLINPRQSFDTELAQFNQDGLAGVLKEPILWMRDEIGKSDKYIITAKILYLAYLATEYSGNPDFDYIFPVFEISPQYFDTRWLIHHFDYTDEFEFVESILTLDIVDRISNTGDEYIEGWKDALREEIKNRTNTG